MIAITKNTLAKRMGLGLEVTIEDITPETAEVYLAVNNNIRPLITRDVTAYANVMRRGEWQLTHQGIAFNEDGFLVDGQHRLAAIVESGVTVRMIVTRGVKRADAMDCGRGRSLAVRTGLPNRQAEVANYCMRAADGMDHRMHSADMITRFVAGTRMGQEIQFVSEWPTRKRIFGSSAFKAACAANVVGGKSSREYLNTLVHSLANYDLQQLPPVGVVFLKQISGTSVLSKDVKTHTLGSLARYIKVTREGNKDDISLRVSDSEGVQLVRWFKDVIRVNLQSIGLAP